MHTQNTRDSEQGQNEAKKKHVLCPDCQAVNPTDATRCAECDFPIRAHRDLARIEQVKADEAKAEEGTEKNGEDARKKRNGDILADLFGW